MSLEDSFRDTFATIWQTLSFGSGPLDLAKTIVPSRGTGDGPDLSIRTLPALSPELELGPTIGKGGSAFVYLAKQLSLHRDVAVKVLRDDVLSQKATRELLSEAWITGLLQHPNIVPVYALGRDDHGAPMLVMKCIGGTSWRDFIHKPEEHREVFGAQTELEWHLDVLMQVAKAIHFAHDKGIVHRDLKPDNVMIGEFGEVYVLDWGLAVSVDDDSGRFRSAKDVDAIAGTPGYMAPEMVDYAGGFGISRRTDVYLLGALLHEILTKKPRHFGKALFEVMFSAYRSEPFAYGDDVPAELAAIANKACARDPADRFRSADEVRRALLEFVRHKGSAELAEQAAARSSRLAALIAEGREEDGAELHRAFAEARFGFAQALRIWPENSRARAGLEVALRAMAEHELSRGAIEQAEVLVAELSGADERAVLGARIAELRERRDRERAEMAKLKRLREDVDVKIGARARALLAAVLAGAWALLPFTMALARRSGWLIVTWDLYILQTATFGAMLLIALYIGRGPFLRTAVNRRIMSAALLVFFAMVVHRVVAWIMSFHYDVAIVQELFIYAIAAAMMSIYVDARLFGSALVYLIAFVCGGFRPDLAYELTGLANLLGLSAMAYVWTRR